MALPNKGEVLRRMAGELAHELNNLFTAINGNLQLIEHKDFPRETVLEIISDVLHSTAQGVALAKDLQTFCGYQDLRPELFNLCSTITEIFSLPFLDGIDVWLEFSVDPCPVFLDKAKTRTMLTAIVTNARSTIKAGGSIKCTMCVVDLDKPETDGSAPCVLLSICESGRNVSPDILRSTMDPMFTAK